MMKPPPSFISATEPSPRQVALVFVCSIVVLVMLDVAGGFFFARLYDSSRYSLAHVMASAKPEILVFGSSTAARGIDPGILESALGKKSYSLAQDGTDLFYGTIQMRNLPPAPAPSLLIWGIDPAAFIGGFGNENFRQIVRLAPYMKKDDVLRGYLAVNDEFIAMKSISRAYPYVAQAKQLIKDIIRGRTGDPRNYSPLRGSIEQPAAAKPPPATAVTLGQAPPVSTEAQQALALVADEIARRGVRLVLVITPLYNTLPRSRQPEYSAVIAAIRETLRGENICDLMDFESPALTALGSDPAMFHDGPHLNAQGAAHFTTLLAEAISARCFTL